MYSSISMQPEKRNTQEEVDKAMQPEKLDTQGELDKVKQAEKCDTESPDPTAEQNNINTVRVVATAITQAPNPLTSTLPDMRTVSIH